ncbi:unnamed protein product, partial [Darwinula stevensoni]
LEVWDAIENLTMEIYFEEDGILMNAIDLDSYPIDRNVTFLPRLNQGVVSMFAVKSNNGTVIDHVVIDQFNAFNERIRFQFPVEGLVNVTVAAFNEFQQWVYSTEQYEIRIVGKVQKMKIDDYGLITKPGSEKNLTISFESLGVNTCLLVDFGDGSIPYTYGEEKTCNTRKPNSYQNGIKLTNPLLVRHIYVDGDVYNVTAEAWNRLSQTSENLMITVDPNCTQLGVAIETHEDSYLMSMPFTITGNVQLNCTSVSTTQAWNITEVDELTRSYKKTVNIEDKLVGWNASLIVVPALFLPYGYYRFEFIVDMSGMYRVSLTLLRASFIATGYLKGILIAGYQGKGGEKLMKNNVTIGYNSK